MASGSRRSLAISGNGTYALCREANAAFWRATVLPLAAKVAGALEAWLAPAFGDDTRAGGGRGGLRLWF